MSCTASLSALSDWMCDGLVAQASKQYSSVIRAPAHFVEMLFWIEDKRFPVHIGVDPIAMIRATIFNLQGKALQGASTIAQQVYTIRLSRSRKTSRSLPHKMKQISGSLYLSAMTSKASI